MLWPDPAQRQRFVDIRDNLRANFVKKDAEPETGTGSLGNLGNIFGS
ncbi:hypothetical protein [Rhodococcus sp. (in: high G+C Gram-positive bacteria)]